MRFSAFVGRASEDAWYISPPLAAKPPVFPPPPGVPCDQRTGGTHAQRGSTRYCPGVQPTQSRAALPSLDSQPMICGMIARLLPTQQKENLVAFKCDIWGYLWVMLCNMHNYCLKYP